MPVLPLERQQQQIPFLGQPGLSCVQSDPQDWAAAIAAIVPVHICEPLEHPHDFWNETAIVGLGSVTAIATEGSPISVHTGDAATAQLMVPYAGNGTWTCDARRFDNPAGDSVLYVPPAALTLENTVTSGVALNYAPNALLHTAITMGGSEAVQRNLQQTFNQPQRLSLRDAASRELIVCIYQALATIDQTAKAAADALPLLRFDDLLTRLLVLLLVPELRSNSPGPAAATLSPADRRIRELMAWMDAHLDQPLGLSDLEAQSNYSRRTLQYLFRKQVGCTPMQWLRRRRLDQALHMLNTETAKLSVLAVAHRCGYTTLAAFSRDFRARHGVRPSDVLRQRSL